MVSQLKANLLSACAALLALTSFGQSTEEQLDQIVQDDQLMGMSVIFVCNGQANFVYHNGHSDPQQQNPLTDDTFYRIASISKMISATGAMLLYDQGLLDLDEDISEYLGFECRNPSYPNVPITTRMLLSHTSSIQDGNGYSPFLNATYASNNDLPVIEGLLHPDGDYFTSNIWRTETPGTHFAYSNLNFGVVATVIEAVSNQRFDVFMREQLFEPMGLSCSYNVADIEDINNLSPLYRNQGGWVAQVDDYQGVQPTPVELADYTPGGNGLRFAPQGGLRSSTLDLSRLLLLHMYDGYDSFSSSQLISAPTMQLMHTPIWTFNGSNGDNYFNLFNEWGLGIQQTTNTDGGDIVIDGVPFLGHPGEAYGLISDLYFNKDLGNGVIFLTNGAWNGFSFGNNSAFYTLEEQVFEVFEAYSSNCAFSTSDLEERHFSAYPNPAYAGETITLEGELFSGEQLQLFSIDGKFVASFQVQNRTLQLPELSKGVYLLGSQTSSFPPLRLMID